MILCTWRSHNKREKTTRTGIIISATTCAWMCVCVSNTLARKHTLTAWDDTAETTQQEIFVGSKFAWITTSWCTSSSSSLTLRHCQWPFEWRRTCCFIQWTEHFCIVVVACLLVFHVREFYVFRVCCLFNDCLKWNEGKKKFPKINKRNFRCFKQLVKLDLNVRGRERA